MISTNTNTVKRFCFTLSGDCCSVFTAALFELREEISISEESNGTICFFYHIVSLKIWGLVTVLGNHR